MAENTVNVVRERIEVAFLGAGASRKELELICQYPDAATVMLEALRKLVPGDEEAWTVDKHIRLLVVASAVSSAAEPAAISTEELLGNMSEFRKLFLSDYCREHPLGVAAVCSQYRLRLDRGESILRSAKYELQGNYAVLETALREQAGLEEMIAKAKTTLLSEIDLSPRVLLALQRGICRGGVSLDSVTVYDVLNRFNDRRELSSVIGLGPKGVEEVLAQFNDCFFELFGENNLPGL